MTTPRTPSVAAFFLTFLTLSALAQAPVINNVDMYRAGTGQRVTLSGSNFGTNTTNLAVYFGASQATIEVLEDQVMEVTVPAGATFQMISVTRIDLGLTAFSPQPFLLSYGGVHPLPDPNAYTGAQQDFQGESGLYDLCLCDFDGDGKNDIATANDRGGASLVSIFRNTTAAVGAIDFSKTTVAIGTRSVHVNCGDLDGDGKKDLVVSEGEPGDNLRLFVLRNTSVVGSISFTQQTITLAGKTPKRIEIADLDFDGKPELVVTDKKSGNNNLLILPNSSSVGAISFGTPLSIAIPGATSSDGLAVHDLNDDKLPEIVVNQFNTSNSNVFILQNNSTTGNFRFTNITTLTLSGTPVNVEVGDLDGDGKPDIAATQLLASGISVFRNLSTNAGLAFSTPTVIVTEQVPWGIDFGDLDGDKKIDVVVASLINPGIFNPKALTVLNNTSTPGSFSFAKQKISTTYVNRHVGISDLDGDGRPDITFTSIDVEGTPASMISVVRNKNCIIPKITPEGPQVVCSTFPLELKASVAAGHSYQWKIDGTNIPTATNPTYTPVADGNYTVVMTSTIDGCTRESVATQVTIIVAGSAPTPTVSSNTPVCVGSPLNLTASSAGAAGYNWSGPAGYTFSSGAAGTATRADFAIEHAGRYDVDVLISNGTTECVAAKGSTLVEATSLPDFKVGFSGSDVFCTGDSKTLSVTPTASNFTYQWFDQDGAINGETGPTINITTSGTYHFQATSTVLTDCAPAVSNSATFLLAALPTVAFQAPAESCKDTPVTFTNQSTLAPDAGGHYLWEFGDASTSTDTSPVHPFAAVQSFNVKLTASYRGNACPVSLTKSINILPALTASIVNAANKFEFCPGDSLKLDVNSSFASYLWSNLATTPSIYVKAVGTYSVQVTNSIGCKVTPTKAVTLLPAPSVTASANPIQINIGEKTSLSATVTPAGLYSYVWQPGGPMVDAASDSTIANPDAAPQQTTSFTVTATGSNGCRGQATIEVGVTLDNITNLLKPSNFFSPNNSDEINPYWIVDDITLYPQCGVKVFDESGVKVFEEKPYQNKWDGTFNGKQLPNGVYYYLIQCEGEGRTKTGSITLVR